MTAVPPFDMFKGRKKNTSEILLFLKLNYLILNQLYWPKGVRYS